jgi:hypothetical protein
VLESQAAVLCLQRRRREYTELLLRKLLLVRTELREVHLPNLQLSGTNRATNPTTERAAGVVPSLG